MLPVYGWYGATGSLPPSFAILLPAAVLAGAALAIANARADLERDQAAGRSSVAVVLGSARSWWVSVALLVAAFAVIVVPGGGLAPLGWFGSIVVAAGAVRAWRAGPVGREHGWRLQAVGVGMVAVSWIAASLT